MSFALSLSQLLLAVVFAVAGIAKLADRAGTRRALEGFGVPPNRVRAGALALPIAELATAAALLPASTARWGALAAFVLLAIFSAAIARSLRAGSAPDCNCFGGLAQTEVGRGASARNLLLAAVAAFVALGGQSLSAVRWVTVPAPGDRLGIALLIACLAGISWFCWQLLLQNGRLLLRLEDEGAGSPGTAAKALPPPLEPGTAAPDFAGRDLDGEPLSLDSLLARGLPVALVFTDPGCAACDDALGAVAQAQRDRADELTLAVISSGRIDRIEHKASELRLDRVVPQDDEALFDAYGVHGVPGAVLIDAQGFLSRPAALGIDAVREVALGAAPQPPPGPTALVSR